MSDQRDHAAKAIQFKLEEKGYQPGHYQAVWRGYGLMSNGQMGWGGKALETYNSPDATLAILDALIHQGGYAIWDGDGVGCVTQMIEVAYKDRDFWRDQARRENQRVRDLEYELAELQRLSNLAGVQKVV